MKNDHEHKTISKLFFGEIWLKFRDVHAVAARRKVRGAPAANSNPL